MKWLCNIKWLWNMVLIMLMDYGVQFILVMFIGIALIAGIPISSAVYDVLSIIVMLIATALTIWFVKKKYKVDVFAYLHFSGLNYKIILFCALIGLTYTTVLEFLLGMFFYNLIGVTQVAQEFGVSSVFSLFITTVILAPICEELVVRVGMIEVGRQGTSPRNAIIASAIIFGIIHFTDIVIITALICFGYLLAVVFFKTENVIYPIIIHFFNNLFAFTINTLTGQFPSIKSLLFMDIGRASLPTWWLFLVTTVICLVSAYLLWKQFDNGEKSRIDVMR